jgi:hypothetical protein
MKQRALVTYLWDRHLAAIAEFLPDSGVDVLVVPTAHATERLHRIAEEQHCQVVLLESLATEPSPALDATTRALHDVLAQPDWLPPGQSEEAAARLRSIVGARLDADLPAAMATVEALDAARERFDVVLFVTSEDVTSGAKVATAWAKARAVRSLHLAHSLALVDPYTVHAHLLADTLAVYGERGAEGYLDLGIDPSRIVPTGNPAWDVYSDVRAIAPTLRAQMIETFALDQALPIVVFGTTSSGKLTAFDSGDAHLRTLEAFVEACEDLAREGVLVNAVIKDRPTNASRGQALLDQVLAERQARQRYVYCVEHTEAWTVCADLLVAVDSNYLVERMLVGGTGINLVGIASLPLAPVFDAESGIVEAEGHELAASMRDLLTDAGLRNRLREASARRLEYYHAGGDDGGAAKRVAALMTRLAGPAAAPAPRQGRPLLERIGLRRRRQ